MKQNRIAVIFTDELLGKINDLSATHGVTRASVVRQAVIEYLKQWGAI